MSIEVIRDEADKRNEGQRVEMRRYRGKGGRDRTAILNPKPERRYMFLNASDRGVAVGVGRGFELIPKDSPDRPAHAKWSEKHGAYLLGADLLAAYEPIDVYEEKRAEIIDENERRERSHLSREREEINKMARDHGVAGPHQDVTSVPGEGQGEPVFIRRGK